MAARTSLFRYALGDKTFDKLPPELRGLLGGGERRRYRGVCHVNRGSGFFQRLAGALAGLPRKTLGEAPVVLEILPQGTQEGWVRHFPGKRLTTMARPRRGLGKGRIRERSGAVTLSMKIKVDGQGLTMRPESARLFGLPLPGFMAPVIKSSIAVEDGRILVDSDVRLGSGRLIRYRLMLEPEPMSEEETLETDEDTQARPRPASTPPEGGPKPSSSDARTAPVSPENQRRAAEISAAPAKGAQPPDDADATVALQRTPDPPSATADTEDDETIAVQQAPAHTDDDETVAMIRRPSGSTDDASEEGPAPASPGQTTKPVSPSRRRPRRRQE